MCLLYCILSTCTFLNTWAEYIFSQSVLSFHLCKRLIWKAFFNLMKPRLYTYIFHLSLMLFIKNIFYCCSSTVVSIFSPPLSPPQPSPLPILDPTPLWFCPCDLYKCSRNPSPFPPHYPFPPPSGYCQFVLKKSLPTSGLFYFLWKTLEFSF